MKRLLSVGFAFALLSSAFAACTMDFDQFTPGGGGTAGAGGACTAECCSPTDCPAPMDPCLAATCTAGACGTEPIADGTEAGAQTAGDCQRLVCNGGAATSVADDMDVPEDNNECTVDACTAGEPQNNPAAPNTTCMSNGGKVCDGQGECVGCNTSADCMNMEKCDPGSHTCVPAGCADGEKNGDETDIDCGGGTCAPCGTDQKCQDDSDCASMVCEGGGANKACAAPDCNDGEKNGDETDVDCGGSCSGCGPGEGCTINADCEGNECAGGSCVPNCADDEQNNDETDTDCGGATCPACGFGDNCAKDADCASGNCMGGTCAKSPLGATCAAGGECTSGNCADGVCCNNGCGGTCQSCNQTGKEGTCTDIPAGMDPGNECAGTDVCNGMGACAKAAGQSCMNDDQCVTGFCADGVCCNTACNGTCVSCNLAGTIGTCTNIPAGTDPMNECNGANGNCNGMGACGP